VSAKDELVPGDILFLPVDTQKSSVAETEKTKKLGDRTEIDFLHSLEINKVLIYSYIFTDICWLIWIEHDNLGILNSFRIKTSS
jgi:hypothetical protein